MTEFVERGAQLDHDEAGIVGLVEGCSRSLRAS